VKAPNEFEVHVVSELHCRVKGVEELYQFRYGQLREWKSGNDVELRF